MNDIISETFGQCVWCLKPAGDVHQCASCRNQVGIEGAWAAGMRDGVLKALINGYKFESQREGAKQLSALLHHVIPALPPETVVAHVPTAVSHVRARGFDHAATLARHFARQRQLKHTPLFIRQQALSQHDLGKRARREAAERSFRLKSTDKINSPILLIDDVLTTGATMEACVKLLQQAEAPAIYVAVVARQPKK